MSETLSAETPAPAPTAAPPGQEIVNGHVYWRGLKGELIPEEAVKVTDKLMDETVRKLLGFAVPLAEQVARFKQHSLKDVYDYIGLLAQEYGVRRGGVKGNIGLQSFDGTMKVTIQVADRISFGPELLQAKALVDECLTEWSAESNAALRTIVETAFNIDAAGHVSPAALLSLLRHDIPDPRWQRAMEAIRDSIRPIGTKEYIRFHRRATPRDPWEPVVIDLAAA